VTFSGLLSDVQADIVPKCESQASRRATTEDALIAHTRKNAFFSFQEDNLGSIQPGKLADLAVLDRDYLTVPADDIRNTQVVMTVVGGKVVWDAAAKSAK